MEVGPDDATAAPKYLNTPATPVFAKSHLLYGLDPSAVARLHDGAIADKGYPSKKNRAWLRQRGIATTIPERDDQIAHRRKKPGRPIDFGRDQKRRYKGRNAVERCFNKLKQWRGIAARSDKTARNFHAGLSLAAILQWV